MATKRKTLTLRKGDVIDVIEYPDGNYGAPGMPRQTKRKATKEQMIQINLLNKARRARLKLLQYFDYGDCFITWDYREEARPPDMKTALQHFQKAMRYIRKEYAKRGYEVFWIRNIERGTRGAWHIHLILNSIPDTGNILKGLWKHGRTTNVDLKEHWLYTEDFTRIANYITKDENSIEYKSDGTKAKSRIKESSYSSSRNMPLPEPKVDTLRHWKKEVKPKKGYYILKETFFEGVNQQTGYMYRRYTMIRIRGDDG